MVVEHNGRKLLYSSDLQGPMIEDYANWIMDEDPDILLLDGPPTYLLGYLLNQVNLRRAISNMCAILRRVSSQVILYDHHLPRDPQFRERIAEVYQVAKEEGRTLLIAAEWFGEEPLVLKLGHEPNRD